MKNNVLVVGKNYLELKKWFDSRTKEFLDETKCDLFRYTNIEDLKMELTGHSYDDLILLKDVNTPEIIQAVESYIVNRKVIKEENTLTGNSSNVTPIHTNKIPSDAKTRLQEEFDQLKERYAKLAIFTESDMFENLDVKKKARLHRQELIMELYLDVLKERLDND